MRITARLLIMALLVVAAYLPTAIGQKPDTVNVRPRLTTTNPGVPEVKVAVDRKRVPLGDEVKFTLSPDNVVINSHYRVTLYFGDGKHQVMRQTEIAYVYRWPGDYTYSILVEPSGPPGPTPQLVPAIGVKLSAIPTAVEINRPVDFAAQPSENYPNIKYRFVFADGLQIGWQTEPKATHAYRLPGTYQAYVDIGVGRDGSVKQVGVSLRQAITVTQPAPPSRIAVKLAASATSVGVGSRVTFTARVDSNEPNIQYRFDFGDRSATLDWQASPRRKHKYSVPGTYPARVDARPIIRRPGAQTASSGPLPIEVKAGTSDTNPP